MNATTTRISAGLYEVRAGARAVEISKQEFSDGPGWVARAQWDRYMYSDPLPTKRDAVAVALEMLKSV